MPHTTTKSSFNMSSILRSIPKPSTSRPRSSSKPVVLPPLKHPSPTPHVAGQIANLDDIVTSHEFLASSEGRVMFSPTERTGPGFERASPRVTSPSAVSPSVGGSSSAPMRLAPSDKERDRGPVTDRVVKSLMEQLKNKLPVYSGMTLDALGRDAPLAATISVFCNLAASSPSSAQNLSGSPIFYPHASSPSAFSPHGSSPSIPNVSSPSIPNTSSPSVPSTNTQKTAGAINLIVWSLCELLNRISNMQAPPVQILHSQVYLLQSLTLILASRTRPSPIPVPVTREATRRSRRARSRTDSKANDEITPHKTHTHPTGPDTGPYARPVRPTLRAASTSRMRTLPATPGEMHRTASRSRRTHSHSQSQSQPQLQPPSQPQPQLHGTRPTKGALDEHVAKYALSILFYFIHAATPAYTPEPTSSAIPLTPLARVPLHGFETFATAVEHAAGELLTPGVVWGARALPWEVRLGDRGDDDDDDAANNNNTNNNNINDNTTHTDTTNAPKNTTTNAPVTFNDLHARADILPPTLSFLPPAVLLARFACRTLYHLSVSNWAEVTARILGVGGVVGGVVGCLAVTREGLGRILQDFAGKLSQSHTPIPGTVAASVRLAIFAWLEHAPCEFRALCMHGSPGGEKTFGPRTHLRVEGADRLFELLSTLVNDKTRSKEQRTLMWTALGALLCICPERLAAVEAGKSNNLLEQLGRLVHAPGPGAEIAMRVYTDICRAAYFLPPACEGCALKVLALDLAEDLASLLEHHPPYTRPDAIEVELYADALVEVYRYAPARAQPLIEVYLASHRAEAVKLCVVQAAMTLVVEAPAFPWQPSLLLLLRSSTTRLNAILRALLKGEEETDGRPAAARPLALTHATDRASLRRTLLLSVEALLRLDIAFFLCGPTLAQLSEVSREGVHVLGPPRDHGKLFMSLAMYATWINRARAVQRGEKFHRRAVAYMNASVLTTLFACAQEVVHVWHDTENILCIHAVHHILTILAELQENNEDTSWKFSEARLPALAMAEVALITAYKSAQPEISLTAAKSFTLLSKVGSDPDAPLPSYLTRDQLKLWSPFLGAMAKENLTTGGSAMVQKTIRTKLAANAFPCATHVSGWRECHYRWSVLSPIVCQPEGKVDPPAGTEVGPETHKDRQIEWANHTLALARAGHVCLGNVDPSYFHLIGTHLPTRLDIHAEPEKLAHAFVAELVDMLSAETVRVRETAKQALGSELSVKLLPVLFEHLSVVIPERLGNVAQPAPRQLVLFADQCIAVLALTTDRIGQGDPFFHKFFLGEIVLALLRFLHPLSSPFDLRTKVRFCLFVDKGTKRRDIFTVRRDSGLQITLDTLMSWTSESVVATSSDERSREEYARARRSCQVSALRTSCTLAENLRLKPPEGSAGKDTQNVVSRLFHRYLTLFIKALDLPRSSDTGTKSDGVSQSSAASSVNMDAHILESIIGGITNLVNANTTVGFKQCVEMGYDDDPRIRAVFMKVFTRVLKLGTKFDIEDTVKFGSKKSQLCELVCNSKTLAKAVAFVCSTSEIDTMVPVLLSVLDSRLSMLWLLQQLIVSEVHNANSPTDLFRQNNMCNRLLSAFAKHHGYHYLRGVVRPLLNRMHELPPGCSFELDPAKLRPEEDLEANALLVTELIEFFIDHVVASAPALPSVLVDVCYDISETVNEVWPQSKHPAVGAFLILRFICPAVVTPRNVDLELPQDDPRTPGIRRGLLFMAKIIQNLANNILFGKEAHLVFLNPLLESNICAITQFIIDVSNRPSPQYKFDGWLGMSYDDTDNITLQRFFQVHLDEVGEYFLIHDSGDSPPTQPSTKSTWAQLCSILVDLGTLADRPVLAGAPTAANFPFLDFMSQNARRNTESIRDIFHVCEDKNDAFVLCLGKINVELADMELLLFHIFQTLADRLSSCSRWKVVIDCTGFSPESEIPLEWIKLCVELTPSDIRQNIETAYILNPNPLAQKYLRKLLYVCTGISFAKELYAVSSVSELCQHLPPVESIVRSPTGALEEEPCQIFTDVYQRHIHTVWAQVTIEVRTSHLRITSTMAHAMSPALACKPVEVISLDDVDDVYRIHSISGAGEFVLVSNRRGIIVHFSSQWRDFIIQSIRSAKTRFESLGNQAPGRFGALSDATACLLAIGLVNACHELEWPRGAANTMLSAVCTYMKYESAAAILPAQSNSIILNPSAALALFSERIAAFAPHLTLDVITEFRLGFNKASALQKITCLGYLPPWVGKLSRFADPVDPLYDEPGMKLRDAVRSLTDITIRDPEYYPLMQQHIWTVLAAMDDAIINLAVDELIRAAVDSGVESRGCEAVADVVMTLSSIHVRSCIITRLRQALHRSTSRTLPVHNPNTAWNEIAALSRLALAASHDPHIPAQDPFLIPETAHLVTMLAAAGPLSMRTAVYGMAVNVLHAIMASRMDDEAALRELCRTLDSALDPATVNWFGLCQDESSMEYALAKSDSDQIKPSALEAITEMLLGALAVGATTTGLMNVWRARWMSLVTATAFQEFSYMQTRSFVVLGLLIDAEVDDDFFYQIIVALNKAISISPEGESLAVISMLRCMHKLIPKLIDNSHYLPGVFWASVALLQTGHLPYYVHSMHIMQVTLEKLQVQGAFRSSSLPSVLLEARSQLLDELSYFDELSGFSFLDEFSFSLSLASLLFSVTQHQTLRPVAGSVIRAILRMTADSLPTSADCPEPRSVQGGLVGLFIASLPFCTTISSLYDLLCDSRVDVAPYKAEGVLGKSVEGGQAPTVSLVLIGLDDSNAELIIAFIVAILEFHHGDIAGREMLYSLLTEANVLYPSLVCEAQVHYLAAARSNDWVDERYRFGNQTSQSILTGMVTVLNSILAYEDRWSSANASTSTLSTMPDMKNSLHYRSLEELSMRGLITHLRAEYESEKDKTFPARMFEGLLNGVLDI